MKALLAGVLVLVTLAGPGVIGAQTPGSYHQDAPKTIDPAARYFIYLHGQAVEMRGPYAITSEGRHYYQAIVQALAKRGFVVIGDVRRPNTDVAAYADEVAGQIKKLRAAGVPPDRITVAGFSKGGAITVVTSMLAHEPTVNFVVMAGCGVGGFGGALARIRGQRGPVMQGRVLSIYDEGDTSAGSCVAVFEGATGATFKEVVLHARLGHALFFGPADVWLDPVTAGAEGRDVRVEP